MARFRYGDLVLELSELCLEMRQDLQQLLRYYRASAYKADAVKVINDRVDQLRAVFDILGDDDLKEALADHDAIMSYGPQMFVAGECSVTARVGNLVAAIEPIFAGLVRRHANSHSPVRPETMKAIHRHRNTLKSLCRDGSRSLEIIRSL